MQRSSKATGIGSTKWKEGKKIDAWLQTALKCRQLLGLVNNQGTRDLESHYRAWPSLEVLPGTFWEWRMDSQRGPVWLGAQGAFQRWKPSFDRNCPKANGNNFNPSSQWLPVPTILRSLYTVQGTQKFCLRRTGGLWLEHLSNNFVGLSFPHESKKLGKTVLVWQGHGVLWHFCLKSLQYL